MENIGLSDRLSIMRSFYAENPTKDIRFRIGALKSLKARILEHGDDIIAALGNDLHKSPFEAYTTEISLVIKEINTTIHNLGRWSRPKHKLTPYLFWPSSSKVLKEPYGVVLIIAPWNYPFQLLFSPLVAAIGAGNCAVLKTSPNAPAINKVMERIVKLSFDSRHVAIFHGNREMNKSLLEERFDYIFFTGSPQLGRTVMEAASRHLTPVTLELGGKSPCIIDRDANLKIAARRVVWGKTINSGQTCIAPDYLFVHEHIKEQFVAEVEKAIEEMYGANPLESVYYPRIISQRAMERLVGYLEDGRLVLGGRYDIGEKYFEPTIISDMADDSPVMTDEIFGPIFPLKTFVNIDDVIRWIKAREKPLALYYFTDDNKRAKKVLYETSSGGACINDVLVHVANHRIPFGGVGNSGMGMYHGKYGFETFSHSRSVVTSIFGIDIALKYPPYGNRLERYKRFI